MGNTVDDMTGDAEANQQEAGGLEHEKENQEDNEEDENDSNNEDDEIKYTIIDN